MNYPNLNTKRNEIFAFVLIAVALSFLVNLLSNIAFQEFYAIHPITTTISSLLAFILISAIAYVYVLSKIEDAFLKIRFPAVLDLEKNAFVDLPYCPGSVNLRVYYKWLPEPEKRDLTSSYTSVQPWNSLLHQFVDDSIQAFVLKFFLGAQLPEESERYSILSFEQVPDGIKHNSVVRKECSRFPDRRYLIPRWTTLDTFSEPPAFLEGLDAETLGDRGRFIRLRSAYGNVTFRWSSSIGGSTLTHEVLAITQSLNSNQIVNFEIGILVHIQYNFLLLFSKGFKKHLEWTRRFSNKFLSLNWEDHGDKVTQAMIASLFTKSS